MRKNNNQLQLHLLSRVSLCLKCSLVRVGLSKRVIITFHCNGHEHFKGARHRVGHRCHRRVASCEVEASHRRESIVKPCLKILRSDVKHLRAENRTIRVDVGNDETVVERTNVKLLQQRCFRDTNFVAGLNKIHGARDFNAPFHNLGRNAQSLEEGSLSGVAISGARRHHDVNGCKTANFGRSRNAVGLEHITHSGELVVGEHEANVALHKRKQVLHSVTRVLRQEVVEDLAHHRVLAHQHNGVKRAKSQSDLLHLQGPHIVHGDHEALRVGLDQLLHANEVLRLVFLRHTHDRKRGSADTSLKTRTGHRYLYPFL
mmetsp:Transcript_78276/g.156585  ORF Transcript_78276/g.156585 Transcript_78276/m.156585 type:complete len:316 (-) Transcript_78276:25-972(-)